MGINFSGISSGIDTGAIVESFVYSERAPIRAMEAQTKDYNSQLTNVRTLNSKMQALQKTMQGMSEIGDFLSYSATFGDEDAMSVSANGDATPGMYDVKVTQLASAERDYSTFFGNKDVAGEAGVGTLSVTVGSDTQVDVEITAEDTLEDVVNKINSSEAEVSASLLFTGTEYRIQVTGNETGEGNGISFGQTGSLAFGFTEYVGAQSAKVEIDGYEITSDSNTFNEALPGVTLNVKEITETSSPLEVKADAEEIEETLKGFVDSYNEIFTLIKSDTSSNSTLRSLQLQLGTRIASEIGDVGGAFTALSQIGISTGSDGKLSLDSDDLNDALARDTRGVAQLFAGNDDDTVSGMGDLFDDFIDKYVSSVDGVLSAQESGLQKMISNLQSSILQAEDRISSYEDGLVAKFTAMEISMSQLQSQMSYMNAMAF